MILKGNIRAGGQELATHLLNDTHEITPDNARQTPRIGNEKVEVAEVRGFASNDLHGAFAEVEAIATGTKSTKPLYSLSINPSQIMSREEYGQAIDKIEAKLGLEDQARAVVFHIKNGREHCHVVWSRIDTEKMQARHMEFDRQKLREVARELVRDFGHEMPKHLAEDRSVDRFNDKAQQPTLAEQGQQARSGITPEMRREAVTTAYEMADSAGAFRHALQESGYTLARGDKRGFVVVDMAGDVHALTRQIEGVKAKEIEAKLSLKKVQDLPSVQEAKELHAVMERQKAEIATQERPDSAERVDIAQDALKALTDAQKAELKAIKGHHTERLTSIRDSEAEQIDEAKRAIKEAYRPEWADMFKRQRKELQAVKDQTKTAGRRLGALLSGRAGDAFDFENRNTMAGVFNFVVRGQVDLSKLEKAHKAEKQAIGDGQKLAEREEIRAIKAETEQRRKDARDDHTDDLSAMKAIHADELMQAVDELENARKLSERDGTDLSQGDKHARDTGEHSGFGFARQGFNQSGMGFGRGEDAERDEDEPERALKPPGQSFTPG